MLIFIIGDRGFIVTSILDYAFMLMTFTLETFSEALDHNR